MPSRCHVGVRVLAVEMRKDNSASIRRASQLAQHPEGQVSGNERENYVLFDI